MPFLRPSLKDIADRITADLDSRMGGAAFRRSVKSKLATSLAGAVHGLYGYLDYLARQINPATATDQYLRLWCVVWNILPREAVIAKGQATFTGNPGAAVPTGTLLTRSDGEPFRVVTGVTLASGTAIADIEAVNAGQAGNTEAAVLLQLQSPIEGIQADATVTSDGITGGVEAENDDSLRDRLLLRIRKPARGGNGDDYVRWAREEPGVDRAWCYPNKMGLGTVSLTFTASDMNNPIPDADLVTAVTERIDAVRPVAMKERYIYAPIADSQTITITNLKPDTPEVRSAIEAELKDLFYREAKPEDGNGQGVVPISLVREAISVASGETDHDLVSPLDDIRPAEGAMATYGGVTWQTA
ncbi:baseplate J/gp47 family protein [Endozoicomonas sp. ALB115]|uniref:baseplate J/gp47 family protein n=1 Tax=Endozoicomonas sp. ALB115 TaxID=3403074 RepID=UPI003BB6B24E